jgi:excisionase family DNA binding protein
MSKEMPDEPKGIVSNPDPLLSVKQAAYYLNISKSKMYEIVKKEKFPIVLIDSDIKIRKSILDRFIKQCEQPRCWATATSTSKEKTQ